MSKVININHKQFIYVCVCVNQKGFIVCYVVNALVSFVRIKIPGHKVS